MTIVALGEKDLPKPFWPTVRRVNITVCYASVFGDDWQLLARLGEKDVWESVDSCPAQPPGLEF